MGLSSKKTTTTGATSSTGSQDFSSTTTRNVAPWVTDLASSLGTQIPNTKTTVAGPSGLQQDAFDSLSGVNFGGLFGNAAQMASNAPSISAPDASSGIQKFLNPYLNGVVDATSNDLDVNDARTRTQQTLDMARNNAFGGSGAALTRSMTEGELERARATALGNLRMGAYDQATSAADADAKNQIQAQIAQAQATNAQAALLGQLASMGIGLQADLGGTQRDITNQQNGQDLTNLGAQLGLFGSLPLDQIYGSSTSGTTNTTSSGTNNSTSTTSDPMGALGGLLSGLGSLGQGAGAIGFAI